MLRKELARALKERRLVALGRGKGWSRPDGYVVGLSKDWCAFLTIDSGLPSGIQVMRVKDISKVRRPLGNAILARASLQRAERWPPRLPELLDLYDVRSLLSTAGSLAPVLAIATEKTRPKEFFVGNVVRIGKRTLELHEIQMTGHWEEQTSHWRLRDITRVDLGSPYLENVRAVAGPQPT